MANPEHLEILKQGVEVWNKWREENPDVRPDLHQADLEGIELEGANLSTAILHGADLSSANLRQANLSQAYVRHAYFSSANLSEANLIHADLSETNLTGSNLQLANLREADLSKAVILNTKLYGASFERAVIAGTVFGGVNLSNAIGLEKVRHKGPSTVGIDTIYASGGKIPEVFLRGCGVPENFIKYMSSLTDKAFEYYSCFINYSSKDQDFAERLYADLQNKGVRCWFAPKAMWIGYKIHIHDKLILILSKHSINMTSVENEAEDAFYQERQRGKTVLLPIRLDSAVMDTDRAWAAKLRRSRHIGDFTQWKNHDAYQKALERLIRDLKVEKSIDVELVGEFYSIGGITKPRRIWRMKDLNGWRNYMRKSSISIKPRSQRVEFSIFSPRKITKGSTFILDVWAYLPEFYPHILLNAIDLGRDALLGKKIGVPIEEGAILSIEVHIDGLKVIDSVDTIIWMGDATNASFSVQVPRDVTTGQFPGKAIIKCQGITIAKVLFVITVAANADTDYGNRSTEITYPKSAFASYASENREEVLSWVQGMKKVAPDLDVFLDVFSLRSGQDWKEKLDQHVPTKDVFYLFWSHYAAKSEWVEKEWRLALSQRGLDYIDPVTLEDIDQAPPPPELQALHFADVYASYIQYMRLKKLLPPNQLS